MTRDSHLRSAKGAWEVTRRLQLPGMAHERDAQIISARLGRLEGVLATEPDLRHRRVKVIYDTTRLDYLQVLEALEETGFPVPANRWERLKANWFQYLDLNGRENANAPEAPCCSNPKGITEKKK